MKKINDLKSERAEKISAMEAITNTDLTDETRSAFDGLQADVEELTKDIVRAEKQEEVNKLVAERSLETPEEVASTEQARYVQALVRFFNGDGVAEEFRGYKNGLEIRDDFLTTTDAGLIIKDMESTLNIAKHVPLLGKIGGKKMPNMKGQFDLTAMAEVTAAFVAETVAVPDASADPVTPVTLAPRRLGAYQVVSVEALDSTKPSVWAGIVQEILDAWDRKVSSDAIAQTVLDANDASTSQAGTNLSYADIIGLQANVGDVNIVNGVYLTTPAIAAKLAATVSLTAVEGPVWKGSIFEGTMAGIKAYASSDVPANHLIYIDAAKITTAEFRPKTLLNNPFEYDVEGKLKVTVSGEVDSGFGNYRFASFIPDCSVV